ncbi:MAG: class I SAM-dependent methyltransferase [Planctomycetes bacterium]|nr:class I SAM-dependent methyltransferase [Planctomycetota bacterium]
MDIAHLSELAELEDGYWWHIAKRRLVEGLLTRHFPPPGLLVEGGIGASRNLVAFRDAGYEVAGFDVLEEAVAYARRHGLENAQVHDLGEPWPVEAESANAVVLLDVLEHVADPVRVLSHARSALKTGGGVVCTVPACPWLFGDWDRRLGHHRRYTANLLREHAREAGFSVRWLNHWNAFTLPAAVVVRGFQRLFPRGRAAEFPRVSWTTNAVLKGMARAERSLLNALPLPFGLSLVGVLVK